MQNQEKDVCRKLSLSSVLEFECYDRRTLFHLRRREGISHASLWRKRHTDKLCCCDLKGEENKNKNNRMMYSVSYTAVTLNSARTIFTRGSPRMTDQNVQGTKIPRKFHGSVHTMDQLAARQQL